LDRAGASLKPFGDLVAVAADLTKAEQVDALQRAAQDSFGPPDILGNVAGITGPTGKFMS
jgi:3-oxoacyl-[acyl-carrier protein] reductase